MMTKLNKFIALSPAEKRLFLEAFFLLGIMRAAILTISFKRLTGEMRQLESDQVPSSDGIQNTAAAAIGKAVRAAAANTPWESACLVQVLAAQRMLHKKGVAGVIYLGATMDSSNEEKLRAHAWLKCGDLFITGEEGHEDFSILTRLAWNGGT